MFVSDEFCSFPGWPLKYYTNYDFNDGAIFIFQKAVTCDGVLAEWRYTPIVSRPFKALVARDLGGSRYTIVGINDIPASAFAQEKHYSVSESHRFAVRTGDVIGFAYYGSSGVLTFRDGEDSDDDSNRVKYVFIQDKDYLALSVNQIIEFAIPPLKRHYSIEAIVKDV